MSTRETFGEAGGYYRPAGFIPRGPVWPAQAWLRVLLTMSLIDVFFPLKCEVMRGTISRMERKNLPKAWMRKHGRTKGATDRHALIWMQKHGEMMVGYAFSPMLGNTRVGDEVTLWVKPFCGAVRRVRNHTKPRRWWQF